MSFAELPDENSELNNVFTRIEELERQVNNQQPVGQLNVNDSRSGLDTFATVNTGLSTLFVLDPLDQPITKLLTPAGEIPAMHTNAIVSHATDNPLELYWLESPSNDGQLKILHPEDGKNLILKTGGNFDTGIDLVVNDGEFTIMLWSEHNGNKWLNLRGEGDNLGNHIATIDIVASGNSGEGLSNIGRLAFIDNAATAAEAVALYSDGLDLFSKSNLNLNGNDLDSADRVVFTIGTGALKGGVTSPEIYLTATGDMVQNVNTADKIIHSHSNVATLEHGEDLFQIYSPAAAGPPKLSVIDLGVAGAPGSVTATLALGGQRSDFVDLEVAVINGIMNNDLFGAVEGGFTFQLIEANNPVTYMSMNTASGADIDVFRTVNFNSVDAINVDRIAFAQDSGVSLGATTPNIYISSADGGGLFVSNVVTGKPFLWTHSNVTTLQNTDDILQKQTNGTRAEFRLYSNQIPVAPGVIHSEIQFRANRTTGGETEFARISGAASDTSNTLYEGQLDVSIMQAGVSNIFMRMNQTKNNQVEIFRNIIAGGATEGMTNIGHLDFIDNTATPAATNSIYSDGSTLIANQGAGAGGAGTIVINPMVEDLVYRGATFGGTNIGHLDFIDNTATPAAAVSLYSDGTDLFANTGGGVKNLSDIGTGDKLRF
jgi:hypothetical protein